MTRVNMFVDMDRELVKGSEKRAEDSTKRANTKLEQEVVKKQKIDDAKVDDYQEEAMMKDLMNIVPDEEEIIRADGSSKRYLAFIHMLRNFDREDLETLWKLVKAKHGSTRPEEGYEKVLWGDLITMFEPDSTLYEIAIYAYLYAGREKVSPYICNNHRHAQQEALS
ncbi:hypothetical protein Tco_0251390 [Tanacetum coccineum]